VAEKKDEIARLEDEAKEKDARLTRPADGPAEPAL
jgi:hypothetical protein